MTEVASTIPASLAVQSLLRVILILHLNSRMVVANTLMTVTTVKDLA